MISVFNIVDDFCFQHCCGFCCFFYCCCCSFHFHSCSSVFPLFDCLHQADYIGRRRRRRRWWWWSWWWSWWWWKSRKHTALPKPLDQYETVQRAVLLVHRRVQRQLNREERPRVIKGRCQCVYAPSLWPTLHNQSPLAYVGVILLPQSLMQPLWSRPPSQPEKDVNGWILNNRRTLDLNHLNGQQSKKSYLFLFVLNAKTELNWTELNWIQWLHPPLAHPNKHLLNLTLSVWYIQVNTSGWYIWLIHPGWYIRLIHPVDTSGKLGNASRTNKNATQYDIMQTNLETGMKYNLLFIHSNINNNNFQQQQQQQQSMFCGHSSSIPRGSSWTSRHFSVYSDYFCSWCRQNCSYKSFEMVEIRWITRGQIALVVWNGGKVGTNG